MNLGVAGRGCPEEQSNVDMWFFLATHSSFTTEAGGSGRRLVNDKDIEISQAWVSSFIFSSQEGSLLLSKCAGLEVDESTAEYLFLVLPDVWFSFAELCSVLCQWVKHLCCRSQSICACI